MAAKTKAKVSRGIIAKARKVLAFAKERATQVQNQMELENALYTSDGFLPVTFPTETERRAFSKTKEYDQLIKLIVSMPPPPLSDEVIVIRIPPFRKRQGQEMLTDRRGCGPVLETSRPSL